MTATWRLDTAFLKLDRRYVKSDRFDGVGDLQNIEADEVEELRDDATDDDTDGRENLQMEVREGVARSLGDLSRKGSRGGELKSFQAVLSRKPMV